MASTDVLVHINMNGNEIQNVKGQNLAAMPQNVVESQFWYDTANHTMKFYNGTEAVDMGSQGRIYTEGNGIDITNDVISIDNSVTAGTKCKITYDAQGLVTAGADLEASDIPSLTLSKISDVTASATELNYVDGVTSNIQTQLNGKIGLTDLSIDSGSTNYLGYDNTTGKFSAKVDTTVGTTSTNLVTSGAVKTAIDNALTGALVYQGAWTATGQTDYSSITLPVKKGYMYIVVGSATVGGVEWNAGDYLIINKDIAAGGTITSSDIEKIDNTESSDIVRLNATQTLTNKTIDADDNTISDLTTSNFKSGTIVTSVGSTGSDTSIPTEKAVRSAIYDATHESPNTYEYKNPSLTPSGGVCTWTISASQLAQHHIGGLYQSVDVYKIENSNLANKVICDVEKSGFDIVIKLNSSSSIASSSYVARVVG